MGHSGCSHSVLSGLLCAQLFDYAVPHRDNFRIRRIVDYPESPVPLHSIPCLLFTNPAYSHAPGKLVFVMESRLDI